jgi:hypothetical protein
MPWRADCKRLSKGGVGSPVKHGSSTSSWRTTRVRSPRTSLVAGTWDSTYAPDPGRKPAGWFADVEAIACFLGNLHEEFGRDFVIGINDAQTGIAEDLYWIDDNSPDLEKLARIVGLGSIR